MASIKKRQNGKYQVQVRRAGHPTVTRTFIAETDAKQFARSQETAIDRGELLTSREARSVTFGACLERYLETKTPKKKGAAQEKYRVRQLQSHDIALQFMASVRGMHVAGYIDDREADGLKPSSILREVMLISHVFETARRAWGMESLGNPVKNVELPKVDDARDRRIRTAMMSLDGGPPRLVDEIEVIKHVTQSNELPTLIDIAVATTMRRGEMAGVLRRNINLANRTLFLPKTKNSDSRTVPLSTIALARLQAQMDASKDTKLFKMRADSVTQAFRRAVHRARAIYEAQCAADPSMVVDEGFLVDLRFHDLRHEGTSRIAVLDHIQLHQLSAITGHKTFRMLKRYLHADMTALAMKLG